MTTPTTNPSTTPAPNANPIGVVVSQNHVSRHASSPFVSTSTSPNSRNREINSRFTAGLFRIAYDGTDDLGRLIPDLSEDEIANTDFGAYTEAQFLDDMARVTEYRCDPDLTEILVKRSRETVIPRHSQDGDCLRIQWRS